MRIALISEYNQFLTTGGTEYYTDMLAGGLCQSGHTVLFISKGTQAQGTIEQEIRQEQTAYKLVLLPAVNYNRAEIRQEVISSSWKLMKALLQEFRPDVVHIHTFTTFFQSKHFEACHAIFPKMIFTSHVPGHFCIKGDLVQNNYKPCDGIIGPKCNTCLFYTSWKTGIAGLLSNHVGKQRKLLRLFSDLQIHVVCVSEWQKKQLVVNGYPAGKLHVIRQAIRCEQYQELKSVKKGTKFRIGYLGRLTPQKGSVFLLDWIRTVGASDQIEIVLGIPGNSDPSALKQLEKLVETRQANISRIDNVGPLNKQDFFSKIDCLLIPSFFLETGPIVLLEAVYYGKKVVAPDVGGPLEFAQEFPAQVICYKWNDLEDAAEKIRQATTATEQEENDQKTIFKNKQSAFIQDHVCLYERVRQKSRAVTTE